MAASRALGRRWTGLATIAVLAGVVMGTGWSATAAGCAISEELAPVAFVGRVVDPEPDDLVDRFLWRAASVRKGYKRVAVAVDAVTSGVVHEVEDVDLMMFSSCGRSYPLEPGVQYQFSGSRRNGVITLDPFSPQAVTVVDGDPASTGAGAAHAPMPGAMRARSWKDINIVVVGPVAAIGAVACLVIRRRRTRGPVTSTIRRLGAACGDEAFSGSRGLWSRRRWGGARSCRRRC